MLTRYDLAVDERYPDEVAMMYETPSGQYTLHDESMAKINFLVDVIINLKQHDSRKTDRQALNTYLDSVLVGYLD